MFKITNKLILGKDTKKLEIFAPLIARKARPGQFVMVMPEEYGGAIPLAVAETDPSRGSIVLIFQETGPVTKQLGEMPINESIFAIVGPLGNPATIEKFGTVVCVATGVGIAQILPVCRALKDCGNKVLVVLGAQTRGKLMLEPQIRMACHRLFIATEDGSFERRGQATDIIADLLEKEEVGMVYAIGSVVMMEKVCALTQMRGIKTFIQVTSGISCGTGICASCRIAVGGETVLACQKGPEFDGHAVDFAMLKVRKAAFRKFNTGSAAHPSEDEDLLAQTIRKFFPGGR
jgi:ferredoxin/flavodoxin---NADP+ reductase